MNVLPALFTRLGRVAARLRLEVLCWSPEIEIGGRCSLSGNSRLRATDGGTVHLGEGVAIDRFADITAKHGRLVVGSFTYIGQYSVICSRDAIIIGSNCLIAEHVTIRDQDHRFGPGLVTAEAGFITSPINIGDNVWLGAKVTVTKGVTIGPGSVIGANSVVTQDIPANSVAVGVPARVIRSLPDAGAE